MVKNHITIDDLLGLKQALLDDLQEIIRQLKPLKVRYCINCQTFSRAKEEEAKNQKTDSQ